MAEISLRGVYKSYGRTAVIHGVDCDIGDGEFIVIVGPSGCGKSTLLRMVAGLETVTRGEILIGGDVVNDREPADRDIAMVFQNYALYPHMTVYNNMAYGLKNRGFDRAEIERRVQKAAATLQLDALLARRPRQLSGGQRQRVAMGRAIVRDPKAFLFDEPLSNLDAKLRVQMRLEIKRLHEELSVTSVYVTHDQVEAMTLGQRLLVMNDGRVEQLGRPLDLYQKPASAFVGAFIGSPSMNLLSGSVDGGGVRVSGVTLPVAGLDGTANGDRVTVGIRPEHWRVDADGSGGLRLRAELVEQLGADTLVHGRLLGAGPAADSGDGGTGTVTLRTAGRIDAGGELPLAIDAANVHVFAGDGHRLNA